MSTKLTTDIFITKAKEVHLNRYTYLNTDYKTAQDMVIITCQKHGDFKQRAGSHLLGKGCSLCVGKGKTTNDFIKQSEIIHKNKYSYSSTTYTNSHTLVTIICPTHGAFIQKPKYHLLGKGCPHCGHKNKSIITFVKQATKIHGNLYDYTISQYSMAKHKIEIICRKHGVFLQNVNSHLSGRGCPHCKMSKGEKFIAEFLIKNNIEYIPQKKFIGCRYRKSLPFDFYLPNENICIEFHGEQHYKAFTHFGGEEKFIKTTRNDILKKNYCLEQKIKLIIINDINKINEVLSALPQRFLT